MIAISFHRTKIKLCRTLSCLLSDGKRANNCMAKVTVAKTCQEEGRRDAKHTDAKMEAFSEADLDTLTKYFGFFNTTVLFLDDTYKLKVLVAIYTNVLNTKMPYP